MAYVDAHGGGGGGGYTGLVGAAFEKLDNISAQFNGAQTEFTLTVTANTIAPASDQNLLVTLNGITQEPTIAYTVDTANSLIIFTTPPTESSLFFGTHIRQVPMDSYLSNVSVILPTNGQILLFNGANNTWYNADAVIGGTPGTSSRVYGELLADNYTGSPTVFNTLNTFVLLTTVVYLNGVRLFCGVGRDYEETDNHTITLTLASPVTGRLLIDYDGVLSTASRIYGELLIDNFDGNANTFGTLNTIDSAFTTSVYRNGLRLCCGADKDYVVLDSNTVLFSFTPVVTDKILMDYDI